MEPLEAIAKNTQQVVDGLLKNLEAMPQDKRDWRPLDSGRSAVDQLRECAMINDWAADMLLTRAVPKLDWEAATQRLATEEDVTAALGESATKLAGAIRGLAAEHYADPIQIPWSTEPTTVLECTLIGYWNCTYHLGQINYIQTLYGDNDYHQ